MPTSSGLFKGKWVDKIQEGLIIRMEKINSRWNRKGPRDLDIIRYEMLRSCLYAFNKGSKVMWMIKRTIKNKEERIMVSLYKILVRPNVEYCVSVWSPYYKKDKELLEKFNVDIQKWLSIDMEGLSYEETLRHLSLRTLEERRNRQDMIKVFKMSQGSQ